MARELTVNISAGREAATLSNIIGKAENAVYTGLQALLLSKTTVGENSKILGVPGFEGEPIDTALISISQALNAFCYGKVPHFQDITET